jgi:S-adenosylmethionine synthetase
VDVPGLARQVIGDVGYEDDAFNAKTCSVMTSLVEVPHSQRPLVAESDLSDEEIERIPAADQVTVFGFACRHTPTLMPMPIWLAHRLARRLDEMRRSDKLPWLGADAKTQVAIEFDARRPRRVHGIGLQASQALAGEPPLARLREELLEEVVRPVLAEAGVDSDAHTRLFVNPAGPVVLGGPALHSGLTGRKTGVDTYGEYGRHSGAALSGKDPLRIDRVGAYGARHAAKNVVAAGLAEECEVQLTYSVGLAGPVSVQVESQGTGRIPDAEIARRVRAAFDFRLGGLVRAFDLRLLPRRSGGHFYRRLAVYGQVGRDDLDLPWERTDRCDTLRA